MCDLTKIEYVDTDIVWVKFRSIWWPAEVRGESRLPEDMVMSLRKRERYPIAVVKFFQEESYEYVKSLDDICQYHSSRKHEFIKRGLGKQNIFCLFAIETLMSSFV